MRAKRPIKNHSASTLNANHVKPCMLVNALTAAVIILVAAGCSPSAQQQQASQLPSEREITAAAALPDDVSKIIGRLTSCVHFSKELSEDQTERDHEIMSTMSELHCDTIEQEVDAIGKQYAGNKAVVNALHLTSNLSLWALIPGGAWEPSEKVTAEIRENLKSAVQRHAAQYKIALPNWFTYSFQYQGQTNQEQKIIFINAICVKPPTHFKTEFMFVDDGGACFFEAKYNPASKNFDFIQFHLPYP